MPRKVIVLFAFIGIGMVLNLITESWAGLVIQALFVAGLLAGSEGARAVLRGLAALAFVVSAIAVMGIAASGLAATSLGMIGLLSGAFGAVSAGFMFWCLGQDDVRAWITDRKLARAR